MCHEAAGKQPGKPNILFLLADDWAWPHASCLGTPGIKTPTFDRLAREGVMFRNAHVAAPSCSPSRAAILTGQWHWRLEVGANLRGFIPARFAVYPDLLEQAGYFVGLTGKKCGPGSNEGRPHNAAEDSFNLLPVLLGEQPEAKPVRTHTLHQTIRLCLSIRKGPWKYLDHPGSGGNNYEKDEELRPYILPEKEPDAPGQLYNLDKDPGETTKLYFEQPKIVEELRAQLHAYRDSGRSRP